jgi:hypothetical protein
MSDDAPSTGDDITPETTDSGTDATGKAGAGGTPKIEGDFDADRARAAIAAAREAEKSAKAGKKAADERVAAILKAAGLAPDGKQDPEDQVKTLLARAEAAEKRSAQLATRDAVRSAAAKHSGDVEALLDSQRFLGQLADLDTAAADFGDKVAGLVKAAIKDNPRYAVASSAPAKGSGKQGADHTGNGGTRTRSSTLDAAVAQKLGG